MWRGSQYEMFLIRGVPYTKLSLYNTIFYFFGGPYTRNFRLIGESYQDENSGVDSALVKRNRKYPRIS